MFPGSNQWGIHLREEQRDIDYSTTFLCREFCQLSLSSCHTQYSRYIILAVFKSTAIIICIILGSGCCRSNRSSKNTRSSSSSSSSSTSNSRRKRRSGMSSIVLASLHMNYSCRNSTLFSYSILLHYTTDRTF